MGGRLGRVGPYALLERLGRGGMGEVYLASTRRGEQVALKMLRDPIEDDAEARLRLDREVRALRRVESPYVAQVLDADLSGDRPYLVMEHIKGETLLDAVRRRGPLAQTELVTTAQGLATALAIIHAAGVVHRDLKPANVLLGEEGPVLIDFGIAQVLDATRLTRTGTFLGTPGYAAPELFADEVVGEPADVHAWAATVAFAATGRPTFGRGTVESQMYAILHGQADLKGVPAALLPLIRAALNREPAKRPTAALLADRLHRLARAIAPAEPEPEPETPAEEEERRTWFGRRKPPKQSPKEPSATADQSETPADGKRSRPETTADERRRLRTDSAGERSRADASGDERKRSRVESPEDERKRSRADASGDERKRLRTDSTGERSRADSSGDERKRSRGESAEDERKRPRVDSSGDERKRSRTDSSGAERRTTSRTAAGTARGRGKAATETESALASEAVAEQGPGIPTGNAALALLATFAVPCVVVSVVYPLATFAVTGVFVVLARALWSGHWLVRRRRSAKVRSILRVLSFPLTLTGSLIAALAWPGIPAAVAAFAALWLTGGGQLPPDWWDQPVPVTVAGVVFGVVCGAIIGREVERIGAELPDLRREGLRALAVLGGFVALCAAAVRAIGLFV
ncbi:hypothetical protein Aph01nite_63530 [Acrocarpospora phusangensis]|uniref:Protein kinase domain-containing protein n=1 Tax=Acrocarpospora phusangensis TaxID=1070424 RepID=A0A919QFW9_9ACTN|nr:serine/threonine protein kinase [Acrocarpospora phusangensis]GIH28043.1 hypothetical protein Aph01nite_63530 [Acrocarpospora phusangensis]